MPDKLLQVPLYDVTFSGLNGSFCIAAETIAEAFTLAQEAARKIERSVVGIREAGCTLITHQTVTYNESEGGN